MGAMFDDFVLLDGSQIYWTEILTNWRGEAKELARTLIASGRPAENGCIVTDTSAVRKVRFHGHQFQAYRFIYCALSETIPSSEDVVRHRCHNRRCLNPEHLGIGSRGDNKRDDWEYWANGFDPDYL